ncbi:MAG TPA: hypothetical protein VIX73_22240 [Kofleriaceae bacterium]|jgi:hypothetical protein
MRTRLLAAAGLAVVSLGVIWLALQRPSEQSPTRREPPIASGPMEGSGDLAAMKQEVMALRAQVARLDHQIGAQSASAAGPAASSPSSPAERKKAALEEQRRAVELLAARVEDEPRDQSWSSEIRAELTGNLGASAGSLRSVDCGATLCRAELRHPDKQKHQQFIETLSQTLHKNFQLFFERDGDALATTVFIARPGHAMPALAKELPRTASSDPAR